jgi:membrane protease YdiL (CAAX protease family)
MFPTTPIEQALWVVFSLSAGFCEEVVYRGYLFRQFHTLTGSLAAALLLQTVAFGMAHLVLPLALVMSVSALALLLGGLAIWQKSLIPGMIMHAALGLFGAFASTIR